MPPDEPPSLRRFLLLPLVVGLCWAFVTIIGVCILGSAPASLEFLGQFGDMFGSFNAAMSAIAMCAAIYAAVVQNWQIQEQRRILIDDRKHDQVMLRRAKLEELIWKLDALKVQSMVWGADLTSSNAKKNIETIKLLSREIIPLHIATVTLGKIYFSAEVNSVTSEKDYADFWKSFVSITSDGVKSGDPSKIAKSVSEALMSFVKQLQKRIDYALANADKLTAI